MSRSFKIKKINILYNLYVINGRGGIPLLLCISNDEDTSSIENKYKEHFCCTGTIKECRSWLVKNSPRSLKEFVFPNYIFNKTD